MAQTGKVEQRPTGHILIVASSAYCVETWEARAPEVACQDCPAKPLDFAGVEEVLARIPERDKPCDILT